MALPTPWAPSLCSGHGQAGTAQTLRVSHAASLYQLTTRSHYAPKTRRVQVCRQPGMPTAAPHQLRRRLRQISPPKTENSVGLSVLIGYGDGCVKYPLPDQRTQSVSRCTSPMPVPPPGEVLPRLSGSPAQHSCADRRAGPTALQRHGEYLFAGSKGCRLLRLIRYGDTCIKRSPPKPENSVGFSVCNSPARATTTFV